MITANQWNSNGKLIVETQPVKKVVENTETDEVVAEAVEVIAEATEVITEATETATVPEETPTVIAEGLETVEMTEVPQKKSVKRKRGIFSRKKK
jgi:hypothetical protein